VVRSRRTCRDMRVDTVPGFAQDLWHDRAATAGNSNSRSGCLPAAVVTSNQVRILWARSRRNPSRRSASTWSR